MKRSVKSYTISTLLCVCLVIVPSAKGYYTNNYGDYVGITAKFFDVTETTFTEGTALYNTPTLVGDSLQFNSLLFASFSQNGASDITDGALETTIGSKPNYSIDRIKFNEFGDTTLSGTGSSSTYSSINNSILIKIREIDDVALTDPCTFSVDMIFTPADSWNLADDGAITGLDWTGTLTIDITSKLRELGFSSGYATLLDLTMDNTLNTASQTGTSALILKKETDGLRVTPIIVPEPATIALLAFGSVALLRKRRG